MLKTLRFKASVLFETHTLLDRIKNITTSDKSV